MKILIIILILFLIISQNVVSIIIKDESLYMKKLDLILFQDNLIIYDIPLNDKIQNYIYKICEKYEIEYELVLAVINHESNFNTDLISYNKDKNGNILSYDQGLFQINNIYEDWYAELAGLEDFNTLDIYDNIRMGIAGLTYYLNRWDGKEIQALNEYNMGIAGYKKYRIKTKKISRSYDRKILKIKENMYKK